MNLGIELSVELSLGDTDLFKGVEQLQDGLFDVLALNLPFPSPKGQQLLPFLGPALVGREGLEQNRRREFSAPIDPDKGITSIVLWRIGLQHHPYHRK